MDDFTKRAILSAIQIEKDSHDFYFLAATRVSDLKTRELLMKLACDEFDHMSGFISLYPEDEADDFSQFNFGTSCNVSGSMEILGMLDSLETWDQALSIAIKEETSCIEQYSTLVDAIRIPEVHSMFKQALEDTVRHLESIEAEYTRALSGQFPHNLVRIMGKTSL